MNPPTSTRQAGASRRATASPMPRLAPVTRTTGRGTVTGGVRCQRSSG